jgi:subtilisin family serine protease
MMRAVLLSLALAGAALLGATRATEATRAVPAAVTTQVVVGLESPPLALAPGAASARGIAAEQARFERALGVAIPAATIHWRYRLVANGVSVVLPDADLPRLARLPGVRRVYDNATYRVAAGPDAATIRARGVQGGAALPNGGAGIKIGVIDDGVDQTHPFFDPTGFTMPVGFPKGQTEFTTAKVIVARAFAPPRATWRYASTPFDPDQSGHGTHVAGIAAGDANVPAEGQRISGIAPRAQIGNYKALTIPTDGDVGLDGNAPEIVAAIEAAVADGMDVINLSIGEPEIEPSRDLVALALDAAAAAGVVPVVAAGNDYGDFGAGSLASPGTSAEAITVGATTSGSNPSMAGFSAAGPTPLSLRLKPDVVAPGDSILSSSPDGWRTSSGTSMAAPHVSGAVALLLERHPDWTPAQVKASLTATSRAVDAGGSTVSPVRAGAGLVDVAAADVPLVRATPTAVSFGLVAAGQSVARRTALADAGGGAGAWTVTVQTLTAPAGTTLTAPPEIAVPGELGLQLATGQAQGDLSGTIVLQREGRSRRIPFWARVSVPQLRTAGARALARPGIYVGDTRGRAARVSSYRYPEVPSGGTVNGRLAGPEQVFTVRLARPVANFGVVVLSRGRGSAVEPRIVAAGDENRLTGYAALPLNQNPYVDEFGDPTPVAGALRPRAGVYHVVFDSTTRANAGTYRFRFWVDDGTPPRARIDARTVRAGRPVTVRVSDTGAGVDPRSLEATVDGRQVTVRLSGTVARIATDGLAPGTHRLRLQLSDFQETRNTENVARILPNTRVVTASITVRPA